MSFRFRLRLFFFVIVLVPMIAVALVLFSVVTGSEQGKSDARLSQAQRAASAAFERLQRRARAAGERIGADAALAAAIDRGGDDRIERALDDLRRREGVAALGLRLEQGGRHSAGPPDAVGPATSRLLDRDGETVGTLAVAAATPDELLEEVRRLTGMQVVLTQGARTLASTLPARRVGDLPERGEASIGDRDFRLTSFSGPALDGEDVTVRLLADQEDARDNVNDSTVAVAIVLAVFLLLALLFALAVSRSLHAQIARLLAAARRLGRGDFNVEVPTEGGDEFAQLGTEFNEMARQLELRLHDLEHEQARLQLAVRRVGASFARGLDRDALLEIAVQTAVDGVGARFGRATVRDGDHRLREVAKQGDVDGFGHAMHAAELAALDAAEGVETQVGEASVLVEPLLAEDEDEVLGLITVARREQPFTEAERDLFHYLAAQAAISIENAELHHLVRRQAVTDDLTGLFNHRHFQEVMSAEIERSRRYGHDLALIMLDIDNFKDVNDAYGHMQGDVVLREVGRILRDSARDVDEVARYGGEEMAVILPQTDVEGAYRFAERVRRRIEKLELPQLDGGGRLRVTASFGVATSAGRSGPDKDELVAAADAALYRAKRAGKNRTERAG